MIPVEDLSILDIRRVDSDKFVALLTRYKLIINEKASRLRPGAAVGCSEVDR